MGFRDLVKFNKALLAKQIWRLMVYPDSLVARVFKDRYHPKSDILSCKLNPNCSFIWRSIIGSRDIIQAGTRWQVGHDTKVRVFKDAWVPGLRNGRLVEGVGREESLMVADLMLENGQWNLERLKQVFLPYEVSAITEVDLKKRKGPDKRRWIYEEIGAYSVKSGYKAGTGMFEAHPSCSSGEDGSWWKKFWQLKTLPKVRIFGWRVFYELIPVDMQLWKRKIPVSGICGWCQKDWGTVDHSLFFCDTVKPAWKTTRFWAYLKRCKGRGAQATMLYLWNELDGSDFVEWLVLLWMIWMELCRAKHETRPFMGAGLGEGERKLKKQFDQARQLLASSRPGSCNSGEARWKVPPKGDTEWMWTLPSIQNRGSMVLG